jgi:O-antigen ligase
MSFDGNDAQNQKLRYTLTRYLTSKGLRKDKEGIAVLTDGDIRNIENGIANVNYTRGIGVESRLMKILFEYQNFKMTGDASGHSVMQRIEYWKTSWSIIQKNFWFGVGTGDMNVAFQQEYELQNSKLDPEWRLRSHNQYLSFWVGFGLLGLLWFLFALIYAPLKTRSFHNLTFTIFFIIFMASMLTEDTIESQAGVTFFVFFNSLFLFLYPDKRAEETNPNLHEKN